MAIKKMTIREEDDIKEDNNISIINKQKEENVKVSTCQYSSICVRVKKQ